MTLMYAQKSHPLTFKLDENLPVSSAAILADQSATVVSKAVSDLAAVTNADSLAGAVPVLQRGLPRIRHP